MWLNHLECSSPSYPLTTAACQIPNKISRTTVLSPDGRITFNLLKLRVVCWRVFENPRCNSSCLLDEEGPPGYPLMPRALDLSTYYPGLWGNTSQYFEQCWFPAFHSDVTSTRQCLPFNFVFFASGVSVMENHTHSFFLFSFLGPHSRHMAVPRL